MGTLDTTTSQALIKNYKDALKASSEADQAGGWLDTAGKIAGGALSGATAQREKVQLAEEKKRLEEEAKKKAKKLEIEGYEKAFEQNAEKIAMNAGSLGTEYYNMAFEEAKKLQEQYALAVRNNDKKLQGQLKTELNGLSTNVQALKGNLTTAAEMKSDENGESSLSEGMSDEEKHIAAICTDNKYAVLIDGEFKWKNPKYDKTIEGSKEFFTQEDLNKSLVLKDEKTIEAYAKYEGKMNQNGANFIAGVEGAYDFEKIENRIMEENKNFINQENIASVMKDDFRRVGVDNTFSKQLNGFLESASYEDLGLDTKDWNKDGIVGDPEDLAIWSDLQTDKEKLHKAITDKTHDLYNYETSKGIVAEWMTMHQKNAFYGDSDPNLPPNADETLEQFKARGGVPGKWKDNPDSGYVYNPETKQFEVEDEAEEILADVGIE